MWEHPLPTLAGAQWVLESHLTMLAAKARAKPQLLFLTRSFYQTIGESENLAFLAGKNIFPHLSFHVGQ